LIIVVVCVDCPAIVFLIVILKSPLIGFSVSGLRCANEITVTAATAKTMAVNRNNLLFMIELPFVFKTLGEPGSKLAKSAALLKKLESLVLLEL